MPRALQGTDGRLADDGLVGSRSSAPPAQGGKEAGAQRAWLHVDDLTRFGPNGRVTLTMANKLP